ncbi:hypothetical protein, partial [Ralstonia holmesii]|uniref:hypothetical protein n=1 Tax=Ralstonia holmesii TaxID=3058602 RepID=UPI00292DC249
VPLRSLLLPFHLDPHSLAGKKCQPYSGRVTHYNEARIRILAFLLSAFGALAVGAQPWSIYV